MKNLIALLLISIATAVSAQSSDFTATASGTKSIVLQPIADGSTATQSTGVKDGSRDFDFIYGKRRMPNHRLKKLVAGSHEWVDFITCDERSPLPCGIGDIDYWKASYW